MDDAPRITRTLSLVLLLAACGQPQAPEPTIAVGPAGASAPASDPAAAEAAADRVRDVLFSFDPETCVTEAATQQQLHPNHGRLRAWYLVCLAAAGRRIEADMLVDALRRERPDDPWGEFARVAIALRESPIAGPETVKAAEALAVTLADHPDVLRLHAQALQAADRLDEALALTATHAADESDLRADTG